MHQAGTAGPLTANWPVRPPANIRRLKSRPHGRRMARTNPARASEAGSRLGKRIGPEALVYGVTTAGQAVEANRCVNLSQFRLKLLVDPQQRLECAADVAIATRYDLIDGGFACVGNHGSPPMIR